MVQSKPLSKTKIIIFQFLFGGLFFAFMNWAIDVSEGGSFDLVKFLVRILIYGPCMVLAFYIGGLAGKKKMRKE